MDSRVTTSRSPAQRITDWRTASADAASGACDAEPKTAVLGRVRLEVPASIAARGYLAGTEPNRPRHNFLDDKKIESGPRIVLQLVGGFISAARPHQENVRRFFQGRADNDFATRSFINRAWAGHYG